MTKLTASISCPNCKNDLWDILYDTAECSNCGYKRRYIRKTPRRDEIKPSQQAAINRIKKWFTETENFNNPLHRFEITFQEDTGYAYVVIDTTDHVYTQIHIHIMIGVRGGIKIMTVSGVPIVNHTKRRAKYYAHMLGGTVYSYQEV